jgi:hypothetical protein
MEGEGGLASSGKALGYWERKEEACLVAGLQGVMAQGTEQRLGHAPSSCWCVGGCTAVGGWCSSGAAAAAGGCCWDALARMMVVVVLVCEWWLQGASTAHMVHYEVHQAHITAPAAAVPTCAGNLPKGKVRAPTVLQPPAPAVAVHAPPAACCHCRCSCQRCCCCQHGWHVCCWVTPHSTCLLYACSALYT